MKPEPVDEPIRQNEPKRIDPTSRKNESKRIDPTSRQTESKRIDSSSRQTNSRFIIWIEQGLNKSSGVNSEEREEVESETKRMKVAFKEGPHRKKKTFANLKCHLTESQCGGNIFIQANLFPLICRGYVKLKDLF